MHTHMHLHRGIDILSPPRDEFAIETAESVPVSGCKDASVCHEDNKRLKRLEKR